MPNSCLMTIRNGYDTLTKTEARIADYILKNPGDVITMSVDELAGRADVVKSAVIRCCKSLGYGGYSELKLALAVELSQNKQLNYVPYIYPDDSASDILDKVFTANVKTLHDTSEKIDRIALQKVVDLLFHAKTIYIYGTGTSSAIANDFQYRLMNLGYFAACHTDPAYMKISTMNIAPGDMVIAISHSGRTSFTIEALRLAKEAGAETACVTSFPDSPITKESDHVISIFSDEIQYPVEATSARIAHISVLDAIAIALSAKDYEKAYERSVRSRELINRQRYDVK